MSSQFRRSSVVIVVKSKVKSSLSLHHSIPRILWKGEKKTVALPLSSQCDLIGGGESFLSLAFL